MTSDEHAEVDIDLLADYIGGTLDGAEEAAVARLIAEDPRWRETYELLASGMIEVGAELQALGARPEPMPADVVARLDAALASPIAEPTVIDPALAAPAEPHLAPVRDGQRHLHAVPGAGAKAGRPARRRGRRLRWAAPIAAAAGVLAFAGVGIDQLMESSDNLESATSAAGSADQAAPMMESSSLVSVPPYDRIVTSGTDYTQPDLGTDPPVVASAPEGTAGGRERNGASAASDFGLDPLARLRIPEALVACLEAIAQQRGGTPIAVETVDYARFQGAPALVVRFVADGATWAWAVGPECGAPDRGPSPLATRQVG